MIDPTWDASPAVIGLIAGALLSRMGKVMALPPAAGSPAQDDRERTAAALGIGKGRIAAVGARQIAHEREPEPEPRRSRSRSAGSAPIATVVERPEEPPAKLLRHSGAVIGDRDRHRVRAGRRRRHLDPITVPAAVLHGVVAQGLHV